MKLLFMRNIVPVLLIVPMMMLIQACGKNEEMPAKMIITKIRVTSFPEKTDAGNHWDNLGAYSQNPDLELRFSADSDYLYRDPNDAIGNVSSGYIYEFIFYPNEVSISQSDYANYKLELFDFDSSSSSEKMGEVAFSPFEEAAGYPKSFVVSDGNVSFQIFAYYIF